MRLRYIWFRFLLVIGIIHIGIGSLISVQYTYVGSTSSILVFS